MKRFLFLVSILTSISISLSAQDLGELRIGATGGLDISNTNLISHHAPVLGFNAGAIVDIGLGNGLYVATGARFSQRGVRWIDDQEKCNPGYVVLPVCAGYNLDISDGFSVFAEMGGYAGVGVAGKLKYASGDSISYWDVIFSDSKYSPNRFEAGVVGVLGIELFYSLQLRIAYEQGLTKISAAPSSARSFNTISIGIAYLFNFFL